MVFLRCVGTAAGQGLFVSRLFFVVFLRCVGTAAGQGLFVDCFLLVVVVLSRRSGGPGFVSYQSVSSQL